MLTVPLHVEKLRALVFRTLRMEVKVVPPLEVETLSRAHRGHPSITIRIQKTPHMQFIREQSTRVESGKWCHAGLAKVRFAPLEIQQITHGRLAVSER